MADNYKIEIQQWGLPALAGFSFKSKDNLAYKTYITQEMLKKGYLASNSIYVSVAHTSDIIDDYFEELEPIFSSISNFEVGQDITSLLNGPICHAGFKRLN